MKLYYFKPNTYGGEFFVAAENKKLAFAALIDYLKGKVETGPYKNQYEEDLETWSKVDPDDPETFPKRKYGPQYTLEEFEPGVIVETEIA